MKIYGEDLEEVMIQLINQNFLNEERFAQAYARGKFRMKNWGRNKIKSELKRRQISDYNIRKAMEEIDEDEYLATVEKLLVNQVAKYRSIHPMQKRKKAYQFLYTKGYESEIINLVMKGFFEN